MLMHPKMIFFFPMKDRRHCFPPWKQQFTLQLGIPTPWNQFSLALILSRHILIWHLRQTLQVLLLKCISANIIAFSWLTLSFLIWCVRIVVLCSEISHSNENAKMDWQVIAVTGVVQSSVLFFNSMQPSHRLYDLPESLLDISSILFFTLG